jgi:GT2 family glycosyltransferase
LAVDFTLIDGLPFDPGFTGMLGDDTDFVLKMEANGYPLIIVPEMRVFHPPNIIGLDRIMIRAR